MCTQLSIKTVLDAWKPSKHGCLLLFTPHYQKDDTQVGKESLRMLDNLKEDLHSRDGCGAILW